MKWQNVISKKELAHLRWANSDSLVSFKRARVFQAKQSAEREKFGLHGEVCFECRAIESKLKQAGKI